MIGRWVEVQGCLVGLRVRDGSGEGVLVLEGEKGGT